MTPKCWGNVPLKRHVESYAHTASVNLIFGMAVAQTPYIVDTQTSEYIVNADRCFHIRAAVHARDSRVGRICQQGGVERRVIAVAQSAIETAERKCFAELRLFKSGNEVEQQAIGAVCDKP